MKANEVLSILRIGRTALSDYVRQGKVVASKSDNGRWVYDAESVFTLLNDGIPRQICAYYVDNGNPKEADEAISAINDCAAQKSCKIDRICNDSCLCLSSVGELRTLLYDIVHYKVRRVFFQELYWSLDLKEVVEYMCDTHYCEYEYCAAKDNMLAKDSQDEGLDDWGDDLLDIINL